MTLEHWRRTFDETKKNNLFLFFFSAQNKREKNCRGRGSEVSLSLSLYLAHPLHSAAFAYERIEKGCKLHCKGKIGCIGGVGCKFIKYSVSGHDKRGKNGQSRGKLKGKMNGRDSRIKKKLIMEKGETPVC